MTKKKVPAGHGTKAQGKLAEAEQRRQERIKEIVAQAPPLSDEQVERIVSILRLGKTR